MVRIQNLVKRFDDGTGLGPITLDFLAQRSTVVIGPSGCGKTTLLRLLLGLVPKDGGVISYGDVALTPANTDSLRHSVGYVIQDGGLFPHLTAIQNVTLLARHLRRTEQVIESRVHELASLVQLPAATLQRYPHHLSGGQRQRVALMRALMLDPPYLLLDEPLGALDPMTRLVLQRDLKDIFLTLGKTVLLVTHDLHEAAYFANDVVLLVGGQLEQRGSFDELLTNPASAMVRDFVRAQRVDARLAAP